MSCDFDNDILKSSVLLPNPVLVASYHLATYPPFCIWIGCCSCIYTSSKCNSAQIILKLLHLIQKLKNYCQCLEHYYLAKVLRWVRNGLVKKNMASLCLLVSYGVLNCSFNMLWSVYVLTNASEDNFCWSFKRPVCMWF